MTDFLKKCETFFDTRDFYEVLQVNRNATGKEIKKAYYKISLLVHPDRVDESKKKYSTEKFQILGRIHSILQDSDKRKIYDECGEFDDESEDCCNWMDYWRSIFRKISVADIQNYEKDYIGSETELRDIKKAYTIGKGSMDLILEMVPFSNSDSEPRIIKIVEKMVADGELDYYDCFFNESTQSKKKRKKMLASEEKKASQVNMEDLTQEIKKRTSKFQDFLTNLEEKYSTKTSKKKRKSIESGSSQPAKKAKGKK